MKYSSPGPALLAAGLLFCTLFAPFGAYADNKKDELSAKQNQAQQAYNEAQQELEELQNQQSETQSQIDQLQGQSAEVAAQLSGIYTALQEAQRTLDERTAAAEQAAQALADKQAEYDASLARCKSQMGAMQLLDGGGNITLLIQARSLYEMLTFAETLRELADHNSAALAQLNAEAEALDTARAEAEEKFDGLKPQTKKKFGSVNFNEVGPEEYDREGNPTGRRLFRFKTGAFYENRQGVKVQRKVPLFDSMQQPVKLSDEPGNGSVIRVAFCCEGQGMGGLSLYLNAVQIIRLNTSGERSASDYGFGAEEGGFTSEGMDDDVASTNAAATPDADVPQF